MDFVRENISELDKNMSSKKYIILNVIGILTIIFLTLNSAFAQNVKIGSQTWMAKNLETLVFRNGDSIPLIKDNRSYLKAGKKKEPACGYVKDSIFNMFYEPIQYVYGYQYNWYAVADPRGLCPVGWHVPTLHDWRVLMKYLDPEVDTAKNFSATAGGKMKSTGYWNSDNILSKDAIIKNSNVGLWHFPNLGASNSSGFNAFPNCGLGFGYWAWLWSSEPLTRRSKYAKVATLRNFNSSFYFDFFNKKRGFGVRCLQD
jgi:uncharacterized protein (TIGR02145 family)